MNEISIPQQIYSITKTIEYDDFTSEEKYIVKSPEQVLKSKLAVCYDLVELERSLFNKYKYNIKTFFFYKRKPIEDNPTHTVLVYKENNKWYWFESSWYSYRGIHGPFNNLNLCLNFIIPKLKKDWTINIIHSVEYDHFNYNNMNINQFGNYIISNFERK